MPWKLVFCCCDPKKLFCCGCCDGTRALDVVPKPNPVLGAAPNAGVDAGAAPKVDVGAVAPNGVLVVAAAPAPKLNPPAAGCAVVPRGFCSVCAVDAAPPKGDGGACVFALDWPNVGIDGFR